jgi:hypothetical protein
MKKPQFPSRKIKVTLALPAPLIERMRTVVYWTPTLTLATLAEEGIDSALRKLEKKRRFRKRRGKIPVGRPPKDRSRR